MRRQRLAIVIAAVALALGFALSGAARPSADGGTAPAASQSLKEPLTSHPRLLITQADLPRLQSWASPSNPVFAQGLGAIAKRAKRQMDRGRVPRKDLGGPVSDAYPVELYAEVFAFMANVDPSATARANWGKRARKVLMYAIKKAAKGRKANAPFRDPVFSTGDRSRFFGEGFGLTVDWAYQYFSKRDKKLIRKVFLRWSKEQYTGYPLDQLVGTLPSQRGTANDPALIADPLNVRWSLNNYYLGHARNLGLMAMSLDAADDPGGRLRAELANLTGQWFFLFDKALTDYASGGLSPEGFEYGPDAFGRLAQVITAMRTAGETGWETIAANPAWDNFMPGYLGSIPYSPTKFLGGEADPGTIFQPASFGDEEKAWALDPIGTLAPLSLDAQAAGDTATADAIRWVQANLPEGGSELFPGRLNSDQFFTAILYFLSFDPALPPPADPRPSLPLTYFAPAINRTIARTCWCPEERIIAHLLSFNSIDHQLPNGNDFAFNRNGEWLTKHRSQYDGTMTDYSNSVTIENDKPIHAKDPNHYTNDIWKRGSQFILISSGDPTLVARSFGPGYAYVTGDATNLYNSAYERATAVSHASRSIIWLEPDHIVVYDRADTEKEGRFKRFWLQVPAKAAVNGKVSTVNTPRGQQLFVTTLLPENVTISSLKSQVNVGTPAADDRMRFRLQVEAAGDPLRARFLNVLQGADGGAAAEPTALLRSTAGTPYEGALVAGTAVYFPVDLVPFGGTTVPIPAGTGRVLVTGLDPGATYTASIAGGALTVASGGDRTADSGGVLTVTP